MTIGIITDNSEKWIAKVLKRLWVYLDLDKIQFVLIDNHSTDNTVPYIVSIIGKRFMQEDRFKFYINTTKKEYKECEDMFSKLATSQKNVIIKENINKKELEKLIRSVSK